MIHLLVRQLHHPLIHQVRHLLIRQASHHLTLLNGNGITVHKLIPVNGRMAAVQVIGNGMGTSQVLNNYPKGMEERDEWYKKCNRQAFKLPIALYSSSLLVSIPQLIKIKC